jgi:aryl-alcohol dehydrogenase-like predicted oxidoreductase
MPTTERPRPRSWPAVSLTQGIVRTQLIQPKVQTSRRTTRPRSASQVAGVPIQRDASALGKRGARGVREGAPAEAQAATRARVAAAPVAPVRNRVLAVIPEDIAAPGPLIPERYDEPDRHSAETGMSKEPRVRQLGRTGPAVFPLGLGCMGMSGMYGPTDEGEGIATIHEALERGITLLDTGDFYGAGHNEMLIGRALRGRRHQALLSVKFGALRGPDASWLGVDGRPAAVKNFLAYSLVRLGVDHVDVYRLARLDPAVPIEETVGAIAELVKAGYVRAIGLSEVGAETVRRAQAVHPIADLQIEYSLVSRRPEAAIFPALSELGIGVTAYGVLSRGLLSGSRPAAKGDYRAHMPRFSGENRARNEALIASLRAVAAEKGVTPSQLAIAWVLAKGDTIVPVIGARTRPQLAEALGALSVTLSAADVARLEAAVPESAVAGTRYDERQMRMLDSER